MELADICTIYALEILSLRCQMTTRGELKDSLREWWELQYPKANEDGQEFLRAVGFVLQDMALLTIQGPHRTARPGPPKRVADVSPGLELPKRVADVSPGLGLQAGAGDSKRSTGKAPASGPSKQRAPTGIVPDARWWSEEQITNVIEAGITRELGRSFGADLIAVEEGMEPARLRLERTETRLLSESKFGVAKYTIIPLGGSGHWRLVVMDRPKNRIVYWDPKGTPPHDQYEAEIEALSKKFGKVEDVSFLKVQDVIPDCGPWVAWAAIQYMQHALLWNYAKPESNIRLLWTAWEGLLKHPEKTAKDHFATVSSNLRYVHVAMGAIPDTKVFVGATTDQSRIDHNDDVGQQIRAFFERKAPEQFKLGAGAEFKKPSVWDAAKDLFKGAFSPGSSAQSTLGTLQHRLETLVTDQPERVTVDYKEFGLIRRFLLEHKFTFDGGVIRAPTNIAAHYLEGYPLDTLVLGNKRDLDLYREQLYVSELRYLSDQEYKMPRWVWTFLEVNDFRRPERKASSLDLTDWAHVALLALAAGWVETKLELPGKFMLRPKDDTGTALERTMIPINSSLGIVADKQLLRSFTQVRVA